MRVACTRPSDFDHRVQQARYTNTRHTLWVSLRHYRTPLAYHRECPCLLYNQISADDSLGEQKSCVCVRLEGAEEGGSTLVVTRHQSR